MKKLINNIKNKIRKSFINFLFGDLTDEIPEYFKTLKEYTKLYRAYERGQEINNELIDLGKDILAIQEFVISNQRAFFVRLRNEIDHFGEDGICIFNTTKSTYTRPDGTPIEVDVLIYKDHPECLPILYGYNVRENYSKLLGGHISYCKIIILDDEETYELRAYNNMGEFFRIYTWKGESEQNGE